MKRIVAAIATACIAAGTLALLAAPANAGAPPLPIGARQPDAQVKLKESPDYIGNDVYLFTDTSYGAHQTVSTGTGAAMTQAFNVRVENDGSKTGKYRLIGGRGFSSLGFKATYFKAGTNITKDVVEGKYKTPALAAGQTFNIKAKMTGTGAGTVGWFYTPVVVTSVKNGQAVDAIRFGRAET